MPHHVVDSGVDLFYTDTGSGPPVLLLHGWTCDGTDWAWLESDLEVDHRVINVDHRGHGRSSVVDGPYGAKPMAHDAADLLRHLEVDDVIVVGHSMGTLVASVLAVEHPALVRALVLVDPVYGQADEMLEPLLAAVRSDPTAVAAATFEIFYNDTTPAWLRTWHLRRLAGNPPAVVANALAALYEGPDGIGRAAVGIDQLPRRACPILAIYAGRGSEIAEWDRALAHGPSDVIEVWPEAGHFLHQEQPDRFATAMRAWLGQLPDDRQLDEARP